MNIEGSEGSDTAIFMTGNTQDTAAGKSAIEYHVGKHPANIAGITESLGRSTVTLRQVVGLHSRHLQLGRR